MTNSVRFKLSLMMFLQFFIKGAWFVTLGTFIILNLKGSGTQVGMAFLTQSIGAILPPFIIGLIADRYFSAQYILAVLHLIGAVLLWYAGSAMNFEGFYLIILSYMVLYMPTLALVNSISFRQMKTPAKEFPPIRVLGTLGWIVAGITIGLMNWEQNGQLALTFKMAAIASGLLGFLSILLPSTPPLKNRKKASLGSVLGFDAIKLLKQRSFLMFFLSSIALCIPLAFYYSFTNPFLNEIGMSSAAGKQSLGQISELLFMLLMPLFFIKLGIKKMLALGMLAWFLRYALFAFGNIDTNYWMLVTGIVLHGICFDFFFVAGQIYTDRQAGEQFKSAAQGLITLATYGIGMMVGSFLSGLIVDAWRTPGGLHNWTNIWMIPSAIAVLVLIFFLMLFKEPEEITSETLHN